MKISCQSCQAKYTIADEKVLGKVVKIRCKKCSATIVINGNDGGLGGPPGSENVYDYTPHSSAEQWTVNVADGDQRTMTVGEIAEAYRQGVLNDESYCWKEGLPDWLPLREIESLHHACLAGPKPSIALDPSQADEGPTRVGDPRAPNGNVGYGGAATPAAAAASSAAAAAAARRAGGRAPGADLFGGAALAGSEEDVVSSAAQFPAPQAGEAKLTGQRNETSVLFSLNAMPNPGAPGARPPSAPPPGGREGTADASGLIDIRQIGEQTMARGPGARSSGRVDDIMNLAGGGAFSPALNAPMLAPPPVEAPVAEVSTSIALDPSGMPAQKSNKLLLLLLAGGAFLFLAIGAVVVVVVLTAKSDTPAVASATPSSRASAKPPETSAATTQAATTAKAPEPPPSAAPSASASAEPVGDPSAPAFNKDAVKTALSPIVDQAQSCGKQGGGKVKLTIKFSPTGEVMKVTPQAPFEGTPVGNCLAERFKAAKIPAFSGPAIEVTKTVTVR